MKVLPAFAVAIALTKPVVAADYEIEGFEKIPYKTVDDRTLHLFVGRPSADAATPVPAVVFFHGGGWTGGKPTQFAPQATHLTERGLVTVLVEYRLRERGVDKTPEKCVRDAKSAVRFVRAHAAEFGIDPDRIAVGGGSAGGHLAAFVGCVDGGDDPADDLSVPTKPQAMLLFNPVCDNGPGEWGHKSVGPDHTVFSPAHNLSADDPPAVYMLGDGDKLIPVSTAERFRDDLAAVGVRCDLLIYKNAGHGFFNYAKGNNRFYFETLATADAFLVDLGWLPADGEG
ncbi:MAG: alpha/beta hydrolase [Planctomycetota bacterium]